jgi:hypothetical protein
MDQLAHTFSIPHFLAEEDNFGVFFLVTVFLGGGASWLAGRAIAQTWRPWWQVVVYALILGGAVRFLHYSLFDGTLLSLHFYATDATICILAGAGGFWIARRAQMIDQYPWINEAAGRWRWRRRSP